MLLVEQHEKHLACKQLQQFQEILPSLTWINSGKVNQLKIWVVDVKVMEVQQCK